MRWFAYLTVTLSLLLGSASISAATNEDPLAQLRLLPTQTRHLSAEEAFQITTTQQGDHLQVQISIAEGYYLYRERLSLTSGTMTPSYTLPSGERHSDEFFGKTEIYRDLVQFDVDLQNLATKAPLTLGYQGCTMGLCYPPMQKKLAVTWEHRLQDSKFNFMGEFGGSIGLAEQFTHRLTEQSMWLNWGFFFLLGIGLSLTPCLFPLYPILLGILVGTAPAQRKMGRSLLLTLSYVQGMALTYTLLGILVAQIGLQLQAALQQPAVLLFFALLFVMLAGSLFGFYTLQLPSSVQSRLQSIAQQQKGGSLLGAFSIGALSGLICSPCTTAPLSGVLLYVAQSGDLWQGGITLYLLALGMGVPLLLIGASGGRLLPKAGYWMEVVKKLLAFALLTVPLWLLDRLWSDTASQWLWLLWGVGLCGFIYWLNHQRPPTLWRHLRALMVVTVMTTGLVVSAINFDGATSRTQPPTTTATLTTLAGATELPKLLKTAAPLTMVDLYADWCVSCKALDVKTFSDPKVQQQIEAIRALRIDVSRNRLEEQQLLASHQVLGLPAILFFDQNGREIPNSRISGFITPSALSAHIENLSP